MKNKTRIIAFFLLAATAAVGFWVYLSEVRSAALPQFRLGLDLKGGAQLVYEADTKALPTEEIDSVMASLREVIERRVNVFGVTEPVVQVEKSTLGVGGFYRLLVELPGVTDLAAAAKTIEATPLLEFYLESPVDSSVKNDELELNLSFSPSGLSGRYLERASVAFGSGNSLSPTVLVRFNKEGSSLLNQITKDNIGRRLAIVLDGEIVSAPIIQSAIPNGEAEITGQFTLEEAKTLTRDLNLGALPVPITLASVQSIGPSLGETVLRQGIFAGLTGFIIVSLFMILWYRLPGAIAVISLVSYIILVLFVFKIFGVTITAAGIAGFILSLGLAVDANILIFERLKEELRRGKDLVEALKAGFDRAWLSIRDSNLSTILTAVVLFWFGTSFVKGFALVLIIAVSISMLTAIIFTRTFLRALSPLTPGSKLLFLFNSGLKRSRR